MFHVDLSSNIPYESAEQSIPTKDYQLSKRSVLQRVRGTATVGLAYVNSATPLVQVESTENGTNQQNEPGFEIINHRDLPNSSNEPELPPGWEGEKYLSPIVNNISLLFK